MSCYVLRKGRLRVDGTEGHWYVIHEQGKGKGQQPCVAKTELLKLGYVWDWTREQARSYTTQLNRGNFNKAWDERRLKEQKQLRDEKRVLDTHLPGLYLIPFEEELEANPNYVRAEIPMHWRYAKRLIVSNNLDPYTWSNKMNADKVYQYFAEKKVSISYTQKVLRAMNMWGEYLGEHEKKFFKPLKMPKGHQRQRIRDAQMNGKKGTNESRPMTPDLLKELNGKLRDDNYNWIYLSFWLGLRPEEVDSLKNPKFYRWEVADDKQVLSVYQSKLTAIDYEKRWKPIPLLEVEQTFCHAIINGGNFKRPLTKTIHAVLGKGYGCYAGRKGFQDTMLARGWGLENISIWMGHQSIETTWKYYKNKQKFTWKKTG